MEANKILSADLLDILFEGRNKEYGAYDLRKTYQQRLKRSLLIMFSFLLLVTGANFLLGFIKPAAGGIVEIKDLQLTKVESPPKQEIPPPVIQPPPKAAEPIKMKMFTNPLIVKEDPPEDEKPPVNSELDNVKIGTANTDGKEDDGTMVGPPGNDKGLLNEPKKAVVDDLPFTKVEIESEYPGGPQKWMRYLEKQFGAPGFYPEDAVEKGVQGSVMIMFVVDVDGTVSNVTAVSGPAELQPSAIKAIRSSGKWIPAVQNGRKVKSYKRQAITFKISDE